MLNLIFELDNRFHLAASLGPVTLSVVADDIEGATELFKKVLEQYPSDWVLNYQAGYHFMAELEDFMMNLCRRLADSIATHPKPLLGSSFQMRSEKFIRDLEDLGIPILPSPERSARAMAALYRYTHMREALIRRKA